MNARAFWYIIEKMKKTVAAILLIFIMISALAACVETPADDPGTGTDTPGETPGGEVIEFPFEIVVEGGRRYIDIGEYYATSAGSDMNRVLSNLVADNVLTGENGVYTYGGTRYRMVMVGEDGAGRTLSTGETVAEGDRVFFIETPVRWEIVGETDEEYILIAAEIYAYNVFNASGTFSTITGLLNDGNPANEYEYSALKEFVGEWTGEVFSATEAEWISEVTIPDIAFLEGYDLLVEGGAYAEAVRAVRPTDYVLASGERVLSSGSGYFASWWLAEPASAAEVRIVGAGGIYDSDAQRPVTVSERNGVRPVIRIAKEKYA